MKIIKSLGDDFSFKHYNASATARVKAKGGANDNDDDIGLS